MNKQSFQQGLFSWLWPLLLAGAGILLLLHNYFLIEFEVVQLWPIMLIAIGLQVLVRGDLGFSWASQAFGITRGSVEAGTLTASSGELDIHLQALKQPGRLIAGQYTARSRPELVAEGSRAIIAMQRGKTWLLSMADWEIDLARDLPWRLLLSSFLGEIRLDLRGLIINQADVATGLANIHLIAPDTPSGPISLRSTFGAIHLTIPENMEASLSIQAGSLFDIQFDSNHWQNTDNRQYQTAGYSTASEPLEITVRGTFGSLIVS